MTESRPHPFGRRVPRPVTALAVATLALGALAGCGDDTDGDTATDTTSSSAPASPSSSAATATGSPVPTATASPTSAPPDVPDIDPLVVKAVKGALKDGYPALIPTVLPAGWTVTGATYEKGSWTVALLDTTGTPVLLTQQEIGLDALVTATVGDGAKQSGKVNLKDYGLGVWGVYESGTAVGIARELSSTAVVVTAVDADTATELAQTLITAEDSDMPEAG